MDSRSGHPETALVVNPARRDTGTMLSMVVTMMRVREMFVHMRQRVVVVHVRMPCPRWHGHVMSVPMMRIVLMLVFMVHGAVGMAVGMMLGEV
jgi:hypothetical protein